MCIDFTRFSNDLGQLQPSLPQHGRSADQRQTDQGRWVVASDVFEQNNTQRFGLEGACAVKWCLSSQVAFDFIVMQFSETDPGRIDMYCIEAGVKALHRNRRQKFNDLPAKRQQLFPGPLVITGFTDNPAVDDGDLVRANDDCPRVSVAYRSRFSHRQPGHQLKRVFPGLHGFVDIR